MKCSRQRGAALILAIMIVALLAVLGGALLTNTTLDIWIADNYKTRTQSLYLAAGGIDEGREKLRLSSASLSSLLVNSAAGDPLVSGTDSTGTYRVLLHNDTVDGVSTTIDANGVVVLVSTATAGNSRKTVEATVRRGSFPLLPSTFPPDPTMLDPKLNNVRDLERFVAAIASNADNIYDPLAGSPVTVANYGTAAGYRVAVVNGDCVLSGGTGYGLLLVRGKLTLTGGFAWTGLILVIGQGVLEWDAGALGQVTGGIFVARTRAVDGTLLATPGSATIDLTGAGFGSIQYDPIAISRANASFPYLVIAAKEY